ncbi:hypothetical protein KAR91_55645 [Candidatus Pacearchaeota archaeon]|nr:hypothetical protein [Candidatus Pacearchaeota archaeon]
MTFEQKQKIRSMCYREVMELKRKLEACSSPWDFEDKDFFDEVLESKAGKVTQGRHIKHPQKPV